MNAIISHLSALNYLDKRARAASLKWDDAPKSVDIPSSLEWAYTKRQLRHFDFSRFQRTGKELDILVPSNIHVHTPQGFRFHSAGAPLVEGSLLDADNGILVTSALLIFVQLSRRIELKRCIKLGSYICGSYSPEAKVKSGVVERRPLATQAELAYFAEKASALYGSRGAREALPWILENAASPQEIELALPFYLPPEHGGKGFIKPTMNYKVELTPKEQALFSNQEFRVDVCWPEQGVGLEYNSYAEHSGERKIAADEQRRLFLLQKGIHVELVTNQQLQDPQQIDILARMLAQHGVPSAW